jgi:hypothetical protein
LNDINDLAPKIFIDIIIKTLYTLYMMRKQREKEIQMEKFTSMVEQVIALSEICEIPEIQKQREDLIKQMWLEFPRECEMMGLTDGLKG